MNGYLWGWAGWLILGAAYEVWAVWGRKAPGDTLSEFTAHVFRSSTAVGFAALTALFAFLLLWFPLHTRRFDNRQGVPMIAPTQVRRPWRATVRTVFQGAVGAAAMAAPVYEAATHQDAAAASGWAAVGLAISAGVTRVMALPGVNQWLTKFLPFLAAEPKTILGKALMANPSDSDVAKG